MQLPLWVSALVLLGQPFMAMADADYCAEENTASSSDASSDTYQSSGACTKHCGSDYGFAVLQGKKCWCSNVAPSKKSRNNDTAKCGSTCPGYPKEYCGDAGSGVFAYVEISSDKVTSTAGDSGSTTTTSSDTTTSPSVAVETNSGGDVKTVTIGNSAASATGSANAKPAEEKSSGLSGGSIAGVVIGVVGGLALLAGLIFLIFFYRKRARSGSPTPSQDMSAVGGVAGRNYTDNRMRTVYPNGPRDSSVSLQDNEDYSRPVLRLTNPD
ncbi:Carbohydrate-binding WSC subgroup [Penicillium alfredii]|uniref:Carbohydrate-binding WSC subgroup n=1 Tax=Penicillium alfredii TaxID=1506179 RepID=A0A9W9KFH2_9EURO|nr:Carbohydrate-binding WSC subgroup [Penicillium alfredii]KAJ5104549.1 Carbohydrate-binding WSC subgroup [Penicillium alfredii]